MEGLGAGNPKLQPGGFKVLGLGFEGSGFGV